MAVDYEFSTTEDSIELAKNDPNTLIKLGCALRNTTLPMAQRFRALFTLKALKSKESIAQIAQGKFQIFVIYTIHRQAGNTVE
jgi:hypothetical protein